MNNPLLLGLTGPAGVGKSTAAHLLAANGAWDLVSFADPIKHCVADGLGISRVELEVRKRADPQMRCLLQAVGDHGRSLAPLGYVAKASERWRKALAGGGSVCVDDVRLNSEVAAIRRHGGVIVHLDRSGVKWAGDHATERGVEWMAGDGYLINPGTLAGLRGELEFMLLSLRRRKGVKTTGRAA